MYKVGDDVFVFDTCSFASTITEIKDGKIGLPFSDFVSWYDIDSPKVEPYSDEKFQSVWQAVDYRRNKYKIGDEVVLKHITGSGYCIVTDVSENQVEVKWGDFPLAWFSNDLIRYATDADRDFVNAFKNLKLNREEK